MILCQFDDFPALIADVQVQTLTWDFSNLIPPDLTLSGQPTLVLTVVAGNDPDPADRINVNPQVGTANLTQTLQGRPNCAVLAQIGPINEGVKYICQVSCPVTPNVLGVGDIAAGFNHIQGVAPF